MASVGKLWAAEAPLSHWSSNRDGSVMTDLSEGAALASLGPTAFSASSILAFDA